MSIAFRQLWPIFAMLGLASLATPLSACTALSTNPTNGGTIDFGHALIGTTKTSTVTATNSGSGSDPLRVVFTNPIGGPNVFGPFSASPAGTNTFSSVNAGANASLVYSFAPNTRGLMQGASAQVLSVPANGNRATPLDSHTFSLSGIAVAPLNQVVATNAGLTRLGTTSAATLTIKNIGDGNLSGQPASGVKGLMGGGSNLNGSAQAFVGNSPFETLGMQTISLPDGATQQISYHYTPTSRSTDSGSVTINFTNGDSAGHNRPQTITEQLSGQGVGPNFAASLIPGTELDFGENEGHVLRSLALTINNTSTDPNGGNSSLTDLTILSAVIVGNDAPLFSVTGFAPGMVLHKGGSAGMSINLIGGNILGPKSATLVLKTDQGTSFGGQGATFQYSLSGVIVPEPSSLVLLACGTIAMLVFRRRLSSGR